MKTVKYSIPNISCGHCVHTIKTELTELEGIQSVNADMVSKTATISYDDPANEEKIKALLKEINYPVAE
jgi:copper chaperone